MLPEKAFAAAPTRSLPPRSPRHPVPYPYMQRHHQVRETPESRMATVLVARWILAVACTSFMLSSEVSLSALAMGGAIGIAFALSNYIMTRLPATAVFTLWFHLTIVLVDTTLVGATLYASGTIPMAFVVFCIGVLGLAMAGLNLSTIAAVMLGIMGSALIIL